MIVEGAIGDAYGAGFEFAEYEKIRNKNNVSQYETHPLFHEIKGRYTDDTQMAIAIAELIIECEDWTPLIVANKFVDVFKRDVRRGYAKRFFQFLSQIENGQELLDTIRPKSTRNGAAMRAYPLGILNDERKILEKCKLQAQITHQSENAIIAAQAISLATHFFIYNKGNKSQLIEYLQDIQQRTWKANWQGEVKVDAIDTVEATLTILINNFHLKAMLKHSVDFGGDVDTVASLALAIGKMSDEIEDDLPEWLFRDLENGHYGKDYLKRLDDGLLKYSEITLPPKQFP